MRRLGLYFTSLIPAAMLLLARSGHRRYGYFVLLRLVVSISAALLASIAHRQNAAGWMWAMIGILVLFNPLLPIHLQRDAWRVIDLATAGAFIAAAVSLPLRSGGT